MAARLRLRRVRAVLGRGALTETLVAEVEAQGDSAPRVAVVKRLHPNLVEERGAVVRVAEEARVLARLSHPNIPAFLGVGDDDGLPFFAQALIDGAPLPDEVVLPWPELVVLLLDVAGALAAAHDAGVVHRDVSRHNVIVDVTGRGWLVDFGVARAEDRPRRTRSGAIIGTPAAMPPEQARGEPVTAAADLWAIGVLATTWLGAGHPLGIRDDDPPTARLAKVRTAALDAGVRVRLETLLPPALHALIDRCLTPTTTGRPEDGRALTGALEVLAGPLDRHALRESLARRAPRRTASVEGETLDEAPPKSGRTPRRATARPADRRR